MVRQRAQALAHQGIDLPEIGHRQGRSPVAFGKNDIETDRRGACGLERIDNLRQAGTRPRPLPEAFQAGFVNVDDTYRRRLVSARRTALVLVEQVIAQSVQAARLGQQQKQADETDEYGQNDVEKFQRLIVHGSSGMFGESGQIRVNLGKSAEVKRLARQENRYAHPPAGR